jgi:hypothetical protein
MRRGIRGQKGKAMKKTRTFTRLVLSRETLVNLVDLEGTLLDKVAGLSPLTGGSSCNIPRCTCPPA